MPSFFRMRGGRVANAFLWIAILLLCAQLGMLAERFRQPAVPGEFLVGVLIGNLGLVGITYLAPVPFDPETTLKDS